MNIYLSDAWLPVLYVDELQLAVSRQKQQRAFCSENLLLCSFSGMLFCTLSLYNLVIAAIHCLQSVPLFAGMQSPTVDQAYEQLLGALQDMASWTVCLMLVLPSAVCHDTSNLH